MKLNLYNQLKLASELSEAIDTNHATHLEHRSLDAILDLLSIIRQLQEESNVKSKTVDNARYSNEFISSTLGYGRKNS
jgi:hypothetical protein